MTFEVDWLSSSLTCFVVSAKEIKSYLLSKHPAPLDTIAIKSKEIGQGNIKVTLK
ncbi:hypothetical protein X975_14535, partial [Stegodyphus mimosarum]